MRLIVHNMLTSRFLKNVTGTGYPLRLIASEVNVVEQDFNPEFVQKLLPRIDYAVLKATADSIGHGENLPQMLDAEQAEESVLKAIHHVLLELEVAEGHMECPETGRQFNIKKGIPNMLVNEDEVAR